MGQINFDIEDKFVDPSMATVQAIMEELKRPLHMKSMEQEKKIIWKAKKLLEIATQEPNYEKEEEG